MSYLVRKFRKFLALVSGNKEKQFSLMVEEFKNKGMTIGDNFRCFSDINNSEPYLIEIGNNVTISTNVSFITHDNSISKINDNYTDCFGKIKIGNNCFIGLGSIIMPGVTLRDNTIIAAGSVVTKSFEQENIIIGGNPAKIIKSISVEDFNDDIIKEYHNTRNMDYTQKQKFIMSLSEHQLKVR